MIELHLPKDTELERLAIGALWVAPPDRRRGMMREARAPWFADPFLRGVFVVLACYRDLDGEKLQTTIREALQEQWDSRWRSTVEIFQDFDGNARCGLVCDWLNYARELSALAEKRARIIRCFNELCEVCDEYRVQISVA